MSDPRLDLRTAADFYAQTLALAKRYTPEWADYWPTEIPSSDDVAQDPGLVLLKLFAQLAGYTAQVENQIPNQRRLSFFQFMNMQLRPPMPARTALQFFLQEGQPAQRVPVQTPVLDEAQQQLRFQTEAELMVLPAQLSAGLSVIPAQDQYINAMPLLTGARSAATPIFVDKQCADADAKPLNHWFMLGDAGLFKPDDSLQEISITLYGNQLYAPYFALWFDGALTPLGAALQEGEGNRQLHIVLSRPPSAQALTLAALQQELYQIDDAGFSVSPLAAADAVPEYWLLVKPAPEVKVLSALNEQLPIVTGLECVFKGKQIQPQQAAFDLVLLDISNSAYPFGQSPQKNDSFYLRSDSVFARTGALITLTFQFEPLAKIFPVTLIWQFWDGKQWLSFNQSSSDVSAYQFADSTNNFQYPNANGSPCQIQFQCPQMQKTTVAGSEGLWLRVLLAAGGYGQDSGTASSSVTDTTNGAPVDASASSEQSVSFTYTYSPSKYYPPFIYSTQISYSFATSPSSYWCYNAFDLTRFLFRPFKPVADVLSAFYFAFEPQWFATSALGQKLTLYFYLQQEQVQAGDKLEWQCHDGSDWQTLSVDDATEGLSRSGIVSFITPAQMLASYLFSQSAYWFRIVNANVTRTVRIYGMYPNSVMASNITSVRDEVLGSSNGEQLQSFTLDYTPVLENLVLVVIEPRGLQDHQISLDDPDLLAASRQEAQVFPANTRNAALDLRAVNAGKGSHGGRASHVDSQRVRQHRQQRQVNTLAQPPINDAPASLSAQIDISEIAVATDEVVREWCLVDSFTFCGPTDRVFTLDCANGLITFGDGYNGMIPPPGHNNIRVAYYEYSQGLAGNVGAGQINLLRPGISNITGVHNPAPAMGGVPGDSLAQLQQSSPALIRAGGWIVQTQDFAVLAQAASQQVAQANAVEGPDHSIQIALLALSADPQPYTSPQMLEQVQSYVQQYCLAALAPRVQTCAPQFVPVALTVQLLVAVAADQINALQQSISSRLSAYLQPVFGGANQQGWRFGQSVQASGITQLLRQMPHVKQVLSLNVNGVQNGNVSLSALQLPVAGAIQLYLQRL
jgi:hypothetical protein